MRRLGKGADIFRPCRPRGPSWLPRRRHTHRQRWHRHGRRPWGHRGAQRWQLLDHHAPEEHIAQRGIASRARRRPHDLRPGVLCQRAVQRGRHMVLRPKTKSSRTGRYTIQAPLRQGRRELRLLGGGPPAGRAAAHHGLRAAHHAGRRGTRLWPRIRALRPRAPRRHLPVRRRSAAIAPGGASHVAAVHMAKVPLRQRPHKPVNIFAENYTFLFLRSSARWM